MDITIGRIVIFRSRTDDYDVPAIITTTYASLNPKGVAAGHIPGLSSEQHVHLTCFSAGKPGLRAAATDFKVESPHGRAENQGGSYTEWDVAKGRGPGEWRWPTLT